MAIRLALLHTSIERLSQAYARRVFDKCADRGKRLIAAYLSSTAFSDLSHIRGAGYIRAPSKKIGQNIFLSDIFLSAEGGKEAVSRRPPQLAERPSIPLFGLVTGHLVPLSTINIMLDDNQ